MSDKDRQQTSAKTIYQTLTATELLTFEPTMLEDVKVAMLDEEHILPAVKHPHYDAVTSLYAVVIKLHQRVQELETKLTGGKDE